MASVGAATSLVLIAAGCTGPDPDVPERPGLVSAEGGSFVHGWIMIDQDTPFTEYSRYLDGPVRDEQDLQEAFEAAAEEHQRRESLIAECMAAEGFEYFVTEYRTLTTPDQMLSFNEDSIAVPLLPAARADVESFGYGTSDPIDPYTGDDLWSQRDTWGTLNDDYFASLGPGAQRAYNKAYWGTEEPDPEAPDTDAGCGADAYRAVPRTESISPQDVFNAEFGDLALSVALFADHTVFEDQRVVELSAKWAQCMTKAGIDLSGEVAAPGTGGISYPNPMSALTLAMRTAPDGTVGPGSGGIFWDTDAPANQRSLVGSPAEAKIAVADYDCRAETDFEMRFLAVHLELEQIFVDQNRAQLDKMKAAALGQQ
ncbi:MAG: hypothetical protein LBH68_02095 [Bifidobacteriaceae bacterium]|nr:hypothetical protein [Bifidobacteriaceae bacterium]